MELQYSCDGIGCSFNQNQLNWFVTLSCEHRLCKKCISKNLSGPNMNIIRCPQCNFNKEIKNSSQNKQKFQNLFMSKDDLVDNDSSSLDKIAQ